MGYYRRFFDIYHESMENTYSQGEFPWDDLQIPIDVENILDVGCGKGEFLISLPHKYRKSGVDFCIGALKAIKGRAVVGDITKLPFLSNSFDLVACFEVLEHLSYHFFPMAIRELERVSRKYILVSVPNRQNIHQSLVHCPHCFCRFNPDFHLRTFDKTSVAKLFGNFHLLECEERGPLTRDYPKFLNFVFFLLKRRPPDISVCPQCGYTRQVNQDNKIEKSFQEVSFDNLLRRRFIRQIRSFFQWHKRPYWLRAIYERKYSIAE